MICKFVGSMADSLHPNKSPAFSSGGVKLVSGSRRITLDNSLDERLRLLEDRVRHVGIDGSYVSDIRHRCSRKSGMTYLEPTKTGNSIPSWRLRAFIREKDK